jgi:hypothetical protein
LPPLLNNETPMKCSGTPFHARVIQWSKEKEAEVRKKTLLNITICRHRRLVQAFVLYFCSTVDRAIQPTQSATDECTHRVTNVGFMRGDDQCPGLPAFFERRSVPASIRPGLRRQHRLVGHRATLLQVHECIRRVTNVGSMHGDKQCLVLPACPNVAVSQRVSVQVCDGNADV